MGFLAFFLVARFFFINKAIQGTKPGNLVMPHAANTPSVEGYLPDLKQVVQLAEIGYNKSLLDRLDLYYDITNKSKGAGEG